MALLQIYARLITQGSSLYIANEWAKNEAIEEILRLSNFNEETLQELASSIKELGVIQPITVRKLEFNKYQLISGERRLRAAKIAGLTVIPSYIRIADDNESLVMALVENIQRHD